MHKIEMTGRVVGKLLVTGAAASGSTGKLMWLCVCECSNVRWVDGARLRRAETKSCGCMKGAPTHGHTRRTTKGAPRSGTYSSWYAMIGRCTNERNTFFQKYGGAGVTVCDRWRKSFAAFLEEIGERPDGMTLDRIDTTGNYEPSNCRWATRKEQARNVRRNRYVLLDGERVVYPDAAERLGTTRSGIVHRVKKGLLQAVA